MALGPLGIVLRKNGISSKNQEFIIYVLCCLPTKVTNSAQPMRGCGTVNAVEEPLETDATKVII